jgi:hypothetical protein
LTCSMRCSLELLQAGRHRFVRLLAALLALAPEALVRADAPAAPLAFAPVALVRADHLPAPARALALLASVISALVLAHGRASALVAFAPALVRAPPHSLHMLLSRWCALVLEDARAPALFACVPSALVRADTRAPALLVCAPLALVRAPPHSSHRLPVYM